MKRCPVCSAVYPPDYTICSADGTTLIEAQDVAAGIPYAAPQGWPPPPAAKRRVPIFVWVLIGVGAFFFLIVPILALIAIPTMSAMKKHANELSAIKSMQMIQQAEAQYSLTYPANGYACSLAALGGDPNAGAPSATAAQLLNSDITSGFKNGYIFTIACPSKVTVNGTDRITSYAITAVPQTVGKTGDSGFCADDSSIKSDPAGGANCTQLVQ
jgi:type IV pilus assembly protein PilA